MKKPKKWPNILTVATIILGFVLVFANYRLLDANRTLRKHLELALRSQYLEEGATVPPLRGLNPDGMLVEYGFDDGHRNTILFVLSPRCGICTENWSNWDRILSGVDDSDYRLLFVNQNFTPLPKAYVDLHGLANRELIDQIDAQSRIDYRIQYTPQTLLISPGGVVRKIWTGSLVFSEERIREVKEILGVRLPEYEE